jgi:DNA-binding MarR family transcriptional regulator
MASRQASRNGAPRPAGRRAGTSNDLADRLHSAAIHLLRRLRREDDASGQSAPRLSALSVVVFGGPQTMSALAAAEQVRVPTMSRLVAALDRDALVRRIADPADRRVVRVEATAAGRALLQAGRHRRVEKLAADVRNLSPAERRRLAHAVPLLERLAGR